MVVDQLRDDVGVWRQAAAQQNGRKMDGSGRGLDLGALQRFH
jgi:hypothetical protein